MFMRLLCSVWKETLSRCCQLKKSNEFSEMTAEEQNNTNDSGKQSRQRKSRKSRPKQ